MADLLPPTNGNFRFLLPELTCGRPGGRSTPLGNGNFRLLLIDSYSESSNVADQVADLPLP